MKELTKKEIIDVMCIAASYQREVYQLYDIDICEVTKYKHHLSISLHYSLDVVSFKELDSLFCEYFKVYKKFIYSDGCYSSVVSGRTKVAHFDIQFYA